MKLLKIALTGGPCGGKTAATCRIQDAFTKLGYKVFLINETATELLSTGVTPASLGRYDYQSKQFFMQSTKEDVCGQEALSCGADKVLIVCDRGLPDNAAYLSMNDFYFLLKEHDMSRLETLLRYDAVFMLRSAANESDELYSVKSNPVRTESARQAVELDEKLLLAWADHPNLYVIEAKKSFVDKINEVLTRLAEFAEEGKPFLYESKYIIEYPDTDKIQADLRTEKECYKLGPDKYALQETVNGEKRHKVIDQNEAYYCSNVDLLKLIAEGDSHKKKVVSTVYGFHYEDEYIEIETYEYQKNTAVLTIEKRDKNTPDRIPDEFTVIGKCI